MLSSCKKDSQDGPRLDISGFGAVVFVGGDAISIYGSGFDPDPEKNTVLFNGVAGEVATASPNRLQVIAPLLATSGKITVTAHGQSVTSQQSYTIVSLLQGVYYDNFILTSDKQYLLRGNVEFRSKLIILPGTVIYGEKQTRGGLTASDVDFEGTAEHPIVFTSDQPPGSRYPGDWKGISINPGNGILQYVRVEYAGYQAPAFTIFLIPGGFYRYLQVSYSGNVGFLLRGSQDWSAKPVSCFIHHLIAFGCQGSDFHLYGSSITAQFGLGLKDPYLADVGRSSGITTVMEHASNMDQLSNFTLVGYNPDARNIPGADPTVSRNAGSGVAVGSSFNTNGSASVWPTSVVICNSVIAASWRSAFALFAWNNYELVPSTYAIAFRNNFVTGTSAAQLPERGGVLGRMDMGTLSGTFLDIRQDPKLSLFASLNDTTRQLSFSRSKDDLGIKNLVDYNRLHNPVLLPTAGSVLLSSASFPYGSVSDSPFFDKNVQYVGAFGTEDWTKPWSNFDPQQTKY
jgi:hypothetical protein